MSTTRWLLWLAVFQTQALASVNQETSLLETRQIIPQLGRVPDPFWWTGSYSAATPQQIQYLDCNSTQINTLKAAVTATAQVASNLRAVLDNPGGDKTNAAMLNIIFGRAFTRRIRGKDYLARVRGAYDAISKGVAINPTSSQQWSSVRILCSADDKTITAWSFPLGALVTIPKIFFQVNLGDGTPCGAFNTFMPSSQLQVMMHELAHLAGVDRAEPEVYSIADALKLPPNAATLNAENYAFAALVYQSGCASELFNIQPEQQQRPHGGEMRKLLNASDEFPTDVQVNASSLTSFISFFNAARANITYA